MLLLLLLLFCGGAVRGCMLTGSHLSSRAAARKTYPVLATVCF